MWISKKEYFDLQKRYRELERDIKIIVEKIGYTEYNMLISPNEKYYFIPFEDGKVTTEKVEKKRVITDECQGCKHLVEGKFNINKCDGFPKKFVFCDLDRQCKDYENNA